MRRMSSILAVALFATAAPAIFAEGDVTTQQIVDTTTKIADGAADAIQNADLGSMDVNAAATAATAATTNAIEAATAGAVTTPVPADAVVINLTPSKNGQAGCYTIGEPTGALAEWCKDATIAPSAPIKIDGVSYEWVTGSLKNVGGKDLCAFSAEPLKLAEPVQDALKIVHDEAAKPFQQLTLPDTHLAELKLPNAQQVNAQILMPVDVSKITEAAPLVIPGTTLAANLQPCETIDGLIKPEQINKFTASLSKLVEPATAAGAGAKAADDAKAAATGAVEQAADATTKATEEVKEAAAKAGEALKPQEEEVEAKAAEDVSTEAISPANSLTASLAGLAAVAAALAFQFVL